MAALAADRNFKLRAGGYSRTIVAKLAAATKIYRGALVGKNAAGFVVPASDTAGLKIIGIADEQVDNTAGAAGDKEIRLTTGVAKFLNFGADPVVQADMHGFCVVADDNTVRNAGAVNDIRAGIVELIESDGVWVYVDPIIANS
ncbi:MAG: hypothetical protein H0U52_06755 [Chloroflexi bacterium]|nr:hypothetical protein [Chloroflexota bacterium]